MTQTEVERKWEYKLPIELDYENYNVVVNGYKISCFGKFDTTVKGGYLHLKTILYSPKCGKEFYQEFNNTFGVTPKRALRIINKLRWKVLLGEGGWLSPKQIFKYCYFGTYKRALCRDTLGFLHEYKDKINQCLLDNQENLVPIIINTGKTPEELKKSLGKSVWKKIANNSFSKNKLLIECYGESGLQPSRVNLAYSTLKLFYGRCEGEYVEICDRLARQARVLSKKKEYQEIRDIVNDTIDMAEQLEVEINPNWSLNRWREEHDNFSRQLLTQEYSTEKFTKTLYPKLLPEISLDGCTAKLLLSPFEVALEGQTMHHCVASYAYTCERGDYAVYHVTDSKGNVSTLGCNIKSDIQPVFVGYSLEDTSDQSMATRYHLQKQQHYGRHNSKVTDEAREFVEKVLARKMYMNEEVK